MANIPKSAYAHYNLTKEAQINRYFTDGKLTASMINQLKTFRTDFCETRKNAPASQEAYLRSLYNLGVWLNKKGIADFKQAGKQDLLDYLEKEIKPKSPSVGIWARTAIKVFYRQLIDGKTGRADAYPEIVREIKIGTDKSPPIEKDDLLNEHEVAALLNAATNFRDRAYVSLLLDTGMRKGEALELRVKNVHFEAEIPFVDIQHSKTKGGKVALITSAHDIRTWLDSHPKASSPNFGEAFLFVPIKGEQRYKEFPFLTQRRASEILERLAKRAKITHKRVWAHEFRHISASSDLMLGMPETMIRTKHRWGKNSRVMERYLQYSTSDIGKFKMRALGIEVKEDGEQIAFKPRICFRCKMPNTSDSETCKRCNTPLNPAKAAEIMDERVKMQAEIAELKAGMEKMFQIQMEETLKRTGADKNPAKVRKWIKHGKKARVRQ